MGCGGCSGKKEKKLLVNDNCIGCGACVAICDKAFDLNDEGKAFVKMDINLGEVDCLDDAIGACPVSAIQYKN